VVAKVQSLFKELRFCKLQIRPKKKKKSSLCKSPGARKWPTGEAEICPRYWVTGEQATRGDGAEKQAEARHAAGRHHTKG